MGIVYEVNEEECFYGWRGDKAYLNGTAIKVSNAPTLSDTLVATGFPYDDFTKTQSYLGLLGELMQECQGIRRMGAAAVDLAYIACGRFDAFFEYNLHAWDVAAGALLIELAGGKVSDFEGKENFLFGKQIIATNGQVFGSFLEKVHKHFA